MPLPRSRKFVVIYRQHEVLEHAHLEVKGIKGSPGLGKNTAGGVRAR